MAVWPLWNARLLTLEFNPPGGLRFHGFGRNILGNLTVSTLKGKYHGFVFLPCLNAASAINSPAMLANTIIGGNSRLSETGNKF